MNEKPNKHVFVFAPSVGAAGICDVYVILILRAWQTSHKGQQNLTKLNAIVSNIYVKVFPSLNNMYGSSRNSSLVLKEHIM
jgi:hypothetical protein